MEKYYQVAVIKTKKYDGSCEGTALFENSSRALTFKELEDAVKEYEVQVQKTKASVEYAKRHKSTDEIAVIVDILENGTKILEDYFYSTTYQNTDTDHDGGVW